MAEQRWVVDRLEGETAVIETETGVVLTLDRRWLPSGAREGDVLVVVGSQDRERSTISVRRDTIETERRQQAIRKQLEALQRRDPGGDIAL